MASAVFRISPTPQLVLVSEVIRGRGYDISSGDLLRNISIRFTAASEAASQLRVKRYLTSSDWCLSGHYRTIHNGLAFPLD